MKEIEKLISNELKESRVKHQHSFNSDWEAYAVILEEIQECEEELKGMKDCLEVFWKRIRLNDKNIDLGNLRELTVNLIQEASQVAAMCDKYSGKVAQAPLDEFIIKEYTIGETFKYKGLLHICVEETNSEGCCLEYCSFGNGEDCIEKMICNECERKDETNVYFERIPEK